VRRAGVGLVFRGRRAATVTSAIAAWVTVVLAAGTLVAPLAADAHKQSFERPVVPIFGYSSPTPGEETRRLIFYGRVEGPTPCERGRIVRIWHFMGETREILATAKAVYHPPEGYSLWGPAFVPNAPAGTYQAEVRRRVVRTPHHLHRCPSGRSVLFEYFPPAPEP
jgi:hypothetical protein